MLLDSSGSPTTTSERGGPEEAIISPKRQPHPKHRQFLLHASKLRRSRFDCKSRQFVTNARRVINVLADKNLVGVGQVLHARGNVHGLPEIVQPIVQRYRDLLRPCGRRS